MIDKIEKVLGWFRNENIVVGYCDRQANTSVEVGKVEGVLEMVVDKLNSVIDEVNSIQNAQKNKVEKPKT